MAVSVKGSDEQSETGASSTLSFNLPADTDMLVVVAGFTFGAVTITDITYNATSLIQRMVRTGEDENPRIEIWDMASAALPSSGSAYDLVVTLSGSRAFAFGVIALSGVDQASPRPDTDSEGGVGAAPSLTLTTTAGDMVIDGVLASNAGNSPTVAAAGGETPFLDLQENTNQSAWGAYEAAVGASVTMSETITNDYVYNHVAVVYAAAVGAANVALFRRRGR